MHALAAEAFFEHSTLDEIYAQVESGWRTLPLVENADSWQFIGLIPDQLVLSQRHHFQPNGNISLLDTGMVIPVKKLALITADMLIKDAVPYFDQSPYPDALVVVDNRENKTLQGILSYIDIFKNLF